MHLRLMPARWHESTTCVTSLYDSGASSMTSFGDATRIEIYQRKGSERDTQRARWLYPTSKGRRLHRRDPTTANGPGDQ